MVWGTILGLGALYYVARNMIAVKVQVKPYRIAEDVLAARTTVSSTVDKVRMLMMNKATREETIARRKAQELYDLAVGRIFENATDEEKNTLLLLFRKYMPTD